MSLPDKDGHADVISEYVDRWVNKRLLRQLPEEATTTHSSTLGESGLLCHINGNVRPCSPHDALHGQVEEERQCP